MSPQVRLRLRQEVDLIDRFTQTYRQQFCELVKELNSAAPGADAMQRSVRLGIEAINVLLSIQSHLAESLRQISAEDTECRRAA